LSVQRFKCKINFDSCFFIFSLSALFIGVGNLAGNLRYDFGVYLRDNDNSIVIGNDNIALNSQNIPSAM